MLPSTTIGQWVLRCERPDLSVLFVENETNEERLFGRPGSTAYPKDGINEYVVHGSMGAVNPNMTGTKAALLWHISVPPPGQATLRLRLSDAYNADVISMPDKWEYPGYAAWDLARRHGEQPYTFWVAGQEYGVGYLPAKSHSGMFGGNSNWRGPVWMPVNAILILPSSATTPIMETRSRWIARPAPGGT